MYKKLASFFLAVCFAFPSMANVSVEFRGVKSDFDTNPKISVVVARVLYNQEIYWHNSALFNLDSRENVSLQKQILTDIESLKADTGTATSKWSALSKMSDVVSKWKVADRVPLELDYDLLRIREELDARLDDGNYLLSLPFRKYTIEVVGAVEENALLVHKPMAHVKEYLDDKAIKRLEYADSEFVYVIHRNGSVKKVSLGLHNSEHVEVPPDGIIYVPLKELPFTSANRILNEQIATLAGNRLP